MAVTTPTGISDGAMTVRATVSARTRSMAPSKAEAGRRKRWSGPQIIRTRWGTIRPTKPIKPAHRDDRPRDQRGKDKGHLLHPFHLHAQLGGGLFSQGHEVEVPGQGKKDTLPTRR